MAIDPATGAAVPDGNPFLPQTAVPPMQPTVVQPTGVAGGPLPAPGALASHLRGSMPDMLSRLMTAHPGFQAMIANLQANNPGMFNMLINTPWGRAYQQTPQGAPIMSPGFQTPQGSMDQGQIPPQQPQPQHGGFGTNSGIGGGFGMSNPWRSPMTAQQPGMGQ